MPTKTKAKEKPTYKRVTFTHLGKRYERKGRTLAEAHAKAAKYKAELERGEVAVSGSMTVAAWADTWLETYKRPAIGEGQYKSYKSLLNTAIIPAIGSIQLQGVKDVHLQLLLNSREGKSKSDVIRLRAMLQGMFAKASSPTMRLIAFNPSTGLTLPNHTDNIRRSITPEERAAMLPLMETHRAGLWLKLMLHCGIRPGEERALDWEDVDFKQMLIHVHFAVKSKTRNIAKPKSDAGTRDVPIPDVLLPALLAARGAPDTPVLARKSGLRHTESSLRSYWKSFKRELDIAMGAELYRNKIVKSVVAEDLVPYCLRHTYCTDLEDAGVPINIARYLMGHADIKTTSRRYTHTTDYAIGEARDMMNRHNAALSNAYAAQRHF
ncbi:MAG: site-specific integrase [Oscillospiraceae bacterium]|nr:site-specific integrase [Oscillospiraceae bacterium]